MSEDYVEILCKVNKRSSKIRAAIDQVIENYCKEIGHDRLEDHSYDADGYFTHHLSFFDSTLNMASLPDLLESLAPHSKSPPIGHHYFDSAGEGHYFSIVRNQLVEFETLGDVEEGIKAAAKAPAIPLDLEWPLGHISIFNLTLKQSDKAALLELFATFKGNRQLSSEAVATMRQPLIDDDNELMDEYQQTAKDGVWRGQFESLVPYFSFAIDRGAQVALVFDFHDDFSLFGGPLNSQAIEEVSASLQRQNEQLGFDAYKTDRDSAIRHFYQSMIETAAVNFVEELACFHGIRSVFANLRHASCLATEEFWVYWNDDVGLVKCDFGKKASDKVLLGIR